MKIINEERVELALRGDGNVGVNEDGANEVKSLEIFSFDFVNKSSTKRSIYDILHTLKVGDNVTTEYGDGKVTSVFGYRGSGYGVMVDINGHEYVFEKKIR